jgi:uncharacterized lipoprotein YajG
MKSLKILFILIVIAACNNSSDVLYQSEEFTVFSDKVVQGKNVSTISLQPK